MTPAGLDTRRLAQMVGYCLCAGLAAGFTSWGAGNNTRASVAAGAAAAALAAGSYWATSPKNGRVVDEAAKQQSDGSKDVPA